MSAKTYQILYIDDQPDMVNLVRLTLRQIGCKVHGAANGLQGLNMMRELHPDLVLLDLMLPEPDGWQIRQAMQADANLTRLPVILVTAHTQDSLLVGDRKLPPADAYITKPFRLAEMRSTVESVLNQRMQLKRTA